MKTISYRFPAWCSDNIPPATPAAVAAYFGRRGLVLSRESWRKLLRPTVAAIRLTTWVAICDITGEPLSAFFAYQPTADLNRPDDPEPLLPSAPKGLAWNPPNPFAR